MTDAERPDRDGHEPVPAGSLRQRRRLGKPTRRASKQATGRRGPAGLGGLHALHGRAGHERGLAYLMVAPLAVCIGALAIYPTVLTAIEAFFRIDPLTPPNRFTGLGNFSAILSNPQVRQSLENTGWYVLFGVVLTVALGTAIALLLRKPFRGRGVILAIVILPWALPGVVEGVIWSWIYNPTFGVLNSVLKSLHLIGQYQLFIGSHQVETILLISLVQVWQITPLAALIVLAALQAVPDELYEAASVDGASWYRVVRSITLPLIRPALAIATVEALVMSLNIFTQVYVLNVNATTGTSIMNTTYFTTFQTLNFGEGYALALLATVTTVILSIVVVKVLYRKVDYS